MFLVVEIMSCGRMYEDPDACIATKQKNVLATWKDIASNFWHQQTAAEEVPSTLNFGLNLWLRNSASENTT